MKHRPLIALEGSDGCERAGKEQKNDAWAGYRTAIEELYRPARGIPRERGDLLLTTDELEERLDAVAGRSDQLQAQLIADMTTDRYAQRELAALKLLAAAAYDLSVAADAALTGEYGITASANRAAASEILTDPGLRRILDTPQRQAFPAWWPRIAGRGLLILPKPSAHYVK